MTVLIEKLSALVWGVPTLMLFVGSGIFFSVCLRWVQVRGFRCAFGAICADLKQQDSGEKGGLSATSALMAALGAVMGPGNIIGVSSAILLGGAGAVFWMWISAFLGMAARYAESVLAVLHRQKGEQGHYGGPMYVMRDHGFRKTALVFSAAGVLISFTMADALPAGALGSALLESYRIPPLVTGAFLCVFCLFAVLGGSKRIAKISGFLVPVMSIFFIGASVWIMLCYPNRLPGAFRAIFQEAFSLRSGFGGLVGGAIRYGMARGIYSNEAGMGTEPLLAAATSEPSPHRQGLISMTGPFLDTIVFCTFTALIILMAGYQPGDSPAMLVTQSFAYFLPGCGAFIVNATMTMLVLATLSSWAFYGEQCLSYLSGSPRLRQLYRWVYALLPLLCAGAKLRIVFAITDIATAFMAIPNLFTCILLISEVKRENRKSFFVLNSR